MFPECDKNRLQAFISSNIADLIDQTSVSFMHTVKETDCSKEVLQTLRDKGLLEGIDSEFLRRFQICGEC